MPFIIKTRYGAMEKHSDDSDIPAIVERLIHELETEFSEEPDDEHTQVAISNGDWSVTVQVSGLMTLDDLGSIERNHDAPVDELFIRANSRNQTVEMFTLIARGEIEKLLSHQWTAFEQVPPYEIDLFRK
jgi:hypothetical protein